MSRDFGVQCAAVTVLEPGAAAARLDCAAAAHCARDSARYERYSALMRTYCSVRSHVMK